MKLTCARRVVHQCVPLFLVCALFHPVSGHATVYNVTSTADSGVNTLRNAILLANADATPEPHTINILIAGDGPHVISLQSALPAITKRVIMSASGEAILGAPGVQVRRDPNFAFNAPGLAFSGTSDNSKVSWLSITGFSGYGIDIQANATGVIVENCYVGVPPDGVTDAGNTSSGIHVGANSSQIGNGSSTGNLISGNGQQGILVDGGGSFSTIKGNRIGTNAAGTAAVPNTLNGISGTGGTDVFVGQAGAGNLISGNALSGISIGASASNWRVQNNFIGTTADGTAALENSLNGVTVGGTANLIGGIDSTYRNVISGNDDYGISLGTAANDNVIRANYIGLNAAGTATLGDQDRGVNIGDVTGCTIGGTSTDHRNVISGNVSLGVVSITGTSGCTISGNYIGLNAAGDAAVANGAGVELRGSGMVLGGDTAGERNVISGNTANGVVLFGTDNAVKGNYIGTNAAGTAAIGNGQDGIGTGGGGTIGGTAAGEGNLISGNLQFGIDNGGATTALLIVGNYIGTNAAGTGAVPNEKGLWFRGTGNTLGGNTAAHRNVISGNTSEGMWVSGTGNIIQGNYIGTNAAGTAAVGNGGSGIRAINAASATIGGNVAGAGNVISGNVSSGIVMDGDTTNAVISGNLIGTNAAGTGLVANQGGGVSLGGSGHVLGGTTAAERNVISGNEDGGVGLLGTNNTVRGNYIGTNAAGTAAIANGSAGIRAILAANAVIGGDVAGAGNVISGNLHNGITMDGDTTNATISGNRIGTNAAGTAAIPNTGSGIGLGGTGHTVGGLTAAARNVISGNNFQGVTLQGNGNEIRGNYIGTNAAGDAAIGNGSAGIRAITVTSGTIGGILGGAGNVISGNNFGGIALDGDTSGLVITGNKIGTNASGTAGLGNEGSGVGIGGTDHLLGGNTVAARNLISGNDGPGVVLGGTVNTVSGNYIGTTADGTGAIGNTGYGIRIYEAQSGMVGGPEPSYGNLVSGNGRGISIEHESTLIYIRNNIIGLNAAMTAKLPNHGTGIEVFTNNNTIGGLGDGNVIAGNDFQGIGLSGLASANTFQGNWIGTNKALAPGLGNTQVGIYITDAHDNSFGGTGADQPNVIAYNGFIGVLVDRGDGNNFIRNSIFENGLLGMDIGEQGLVPNDDLDPDIAGNERENFPLLTSVVVGTGTEVDGILENEPDSQYRVELFTSPNCDNTGFGEGKTYFASFTVVTGPDGSGVINQSLPPTADPYMSATVTDVPDGNTSEFSPCAKTTGPNPGTIQFYREVVLSYEGVLPTGKAVLTRSHGMAGTVTVNFTSTNVSAIAGFDYVDSDQVVTFLDGEVLKIIEIPLIVDPAVEAPDPEVAALAISNPTGGALLGDQDTSDMLIFDQNVEFPGLIVEDASVTEGNSGQKNLTFNVKLSPTDHDVSVAYLTEPGTAVEGEDYEYVEGTVDFTPSATTQTQTVNVPISGDTTIEPDEIVWLRITCGEDCSTWIAFDVYGLGLIENDDSESQPEDIFKDSFEDLPP